MAQISKREDAQVSDLAPILGDFSQSEKLSEIKPPLLKPTGNENDCSLPGFFFFFEVSTSRHLVFFGKTVLWKVVAIAQLELQFNEKFEAFFYRAVPFTYVDSTL